MPPALPSTIIIISLTLSLLPHPALPYPDPKQPFHPDPSPPATIPSFPEQSAIAGCPLNRLPDDIFPAVKSSCSSNLHASRCCPLLATWLYSAYSHTALTTSSSTKTKSSSSTYEMPLLPDDSETCVVSLEKAMTEKGVDLARPNATCDVVYCFCGIRLHPLSCAQSFSISENGTLVGSEGVKRLERDCLQAGNNRTTLDGCSKCLHSLHTLKRGDSESQNVTKPDVGGRTSMMRSRDCELMGLTWLLNKDRDAYMSTVTLVMRSLMMNTEQGSDPQSCTLGMPLAVDSVEMDGQSSSSVTLKISAGPDIS